MPIIEYLCTEKGVKSRIARSDAFRAYRRMEAFSFAGLNDLCCPMVLIKVIVIFRQRRGYTLQYMAIGISINHIRPNILDFSIPSVLLDVIVDPSYQDFFISKTLHDVWLFIIFPEENDFRVPFEGNFAGDVDLSF